MIVAVLAGREEMPPSCNHCPVHRPEYRGEYHRDARCLAAGRGYTPEEAARLHVDWCRPVWCPLMILRDKK